MNQYKNSLEQEIQNSEQDQSRTPWIDDKSLTS